MTVNDSTLLAAKENNNGRTNSNGGIGGSGGVGDSSDCIYFF